MIPGTIFHAENCGRGASVQDGFQLARGKVIAYLDVDLENPIDALLPMYSSIVRGECDGVVAKRLYQSWRVNPVRLVLSLCYKFLVRLIVSLPVSDSEAGFKMFLKEKILPVLPTIEDRAWFWDTEIVARAADAGLKLKEHPIVFVRDPTKASTVRVVRDSYVYLRRLIAFSWRRGDRLKSAQDRLTRLSVALAKRKR